MNVRQYSTAREFLDAAGAWLIVSEAENNLILGLAADLAEDPHRFGLEEPLYLVVEEAGRPVAAALRTPPRQLILTEGPTEAIEALARYLADGGTSLPGVNGPVEAARTFGQCWSASEGVALRPGMDDLVYRCDAVEPPPRCPGRFRLAEPSENDLLIRWFRRFHEEIGLGPVPDDSMVKRRLDERRVYVWEDGPIVSSVSWMVTAGRAARIGFVYTPHNQRRKGYAANCVAAMTGQLLAEGKCPVCLYADLANPTSNGIYRRIGYRPVCQWQEWRFE